MILTRVSDAITVLQIIVQRVLKEYLQNGRPVAIKHERLHNINQRNCVLLFWDTNTIKTYVNYWNSTVEFYKIGVVGNSQKLKLKPLSNGSNSLSFAYQP